MTVLATNAATYRQTLVELLLCVDNVQYGRITVFQLERLAAITRYTELRWMIV
jgi:hypothetical protein